MVLKKISICHRSLYIAEIVVAPNVIWLVKSTMITSNRPIEDWGKLLGDNAAASAILDRLLHHSHLLKFEGKSYRLKEASKRLALEKKKTKLPPVLPI